MIEKQMAVILAKEIGKNQQIIISQILAIPEVGTVEVERQNSTEIKDHQKVLGEVEGEVEITKERAEIIIDYSFNLLQSSSLEPRYQSSPLCFIH